MISHHRRRRHCPSSDTDEVTAGRTHRLLQLSNYVSEIRGLVSVIKYKIFWFFLLDVQNVKLKAKPERALEKGGGAGGAEAAGRFV